MAKVRPFGVTLIVILELIGSLFFLGNGGFLLAEAASFEVETPGSKPILGSFVAGLSAAIGMIIFLTIGIVLIATGLLTLLIAYGLWTGRRWAWSLCIIFSIFGLIIGVLSLPLGIIILAINLLVLYYLTRRRAKAFFGKGSPVGGSPQTPPT